MAFLRFLRFAFTFGVSGGVAYWMLVRWAVRTFPSLALRRRALLRGGASLWAVTMAARAFSQFAHSSVAEGIYAAATVTYVLVMLCAPVFAAMEFAGALARRQHKGGRGGGRPARFDEAPVHGRKLPPPEAPPPATLAVTRRQLVEGVAGIGILGGTAAALSWGALRGRYDYRIEEVPVRIPGLPRALDGYTIAQISDLHVGLFVGDREMREGFARLHAVKPDLIVVTGDLVDYDAAFAEPAARYLSTLKARDGVYAILGNHDYYTGAQEVTRALARTDVRLLVNRGERIRKDDGGGFALLGVDDLWARHQGPPGRGSAYEGGRGPDLAAAAAPFPAEVPRILLAHQPKYFDEVAGQVALQLSGHTHGGQVNPGFGVMDLLLGYVAGRYTRAGSTLWVNRGFGVAGPPSRVGAPPEVTKVVLISA